LELKHHQSFHPVVHVGLLKPYLTCSNPQNAEDDGKTPDPLPHALSALDFPDEQIYPPELSRFRIS